MSLLCFASASFFATGFLYVLPLPRHSTCASGHCTLLLASLVAVRTARCPSFRRLPFLWQTLNPGDDNVFRWKNNPQVSQVLDPKPTIVLYFNFLWRFQMEDAKLLPGVHEMLQKANNILGYDVLELCTIGPDNTSTPSLALS